MGTCACFHVLKRGRKYRRLTTHVVLEMDEEETRGYYYFKDIPKVSKVIPNSGTEKYKELKHLHQHSLLIEERLLQATSMHPSTSTKDWRIMHEIPNMNFTIWNKRDMNQKDTCKVATMTV